ncbi:isopenicillin-N N-acyltransferase-like protein [Streptomyces aurantiacus]|uniref:C45 family autoproteolytic acyltransferase/hydolase n=1 Tax=Streptomyces aurantiacus TaxID=47760 RepID=UPI00278D2DDA|nr:C45 family peptidase [Streptomyces aurantiacus]MDQ0779976.1 isopenicillin-N N-acyltransferase-like protein [Streptomyces aurantiacus]
MTTGGPAPFIELSGDPYELGRQHGATRAAGLRAFLDDGTARLNHLLDTPVSLDSLAPVLTAFRSEIEAGVPDLAEEIRGLADGAGLGHDEALLLQVRREILGYRSTRRPGGDCTTYARVAAGGHTTLAQTVDLNGDLDDQTGLLSIRRTGSPRRVLMLSFGGLLGYLGMNSDGLAVGINLVLGGPWRPGVPPYLAVRHLLDSAGSVDEALDVLGGLRLASSRSLMLCDERGAAWVEAMDGRTRVMRDTTLVHTNHFLHPQFVPFDELNVFAKNGSLRRLDACAVRLKALPDDASAADHLALLSTPPVFVPDDGDIRRERTVAVVAMRPERRELRLLGSRPFEEAQVFSFDAAGGAARG